VAGAADVVYGYSFILTDLDEPTAQVEHHHRDRAQIEERIKDAKLGVSLRRLPLSDLDANRVWLRCSALALNLLALGQTTSCSAPSRPGTCRAAARPSFVRRMLLCVPARVIHHARQIILRLPAGLPSALAFQAAYTAARGLARRWPRDRRRRPRAAPTAIAPASKRR
jgi:Transposase DDE domain group 1